MYELKEKEISKIYEEIKVLIESTKSKIYSTVNTEMLMLYWNIGKIIINIQDNKSRAKYNDHTLEKLSEKLTQEFGKSFSYKNLRRMRKFFITVAEFKVILTYIELEDSVFQIKIIIKTKKPNQLIKFYF